MKRRELLWIWRYKAEILLNRVKSYYNHKHSCIDHFFRNTYCKLCSCSKWDCTFLVTRSRTVLGVTTKASTSMTDLTTWRPCCIHTATASFLVTSYQAVTQRSSLMCIVTVKRVLHSGSNTQQWFPEKVWLTVVIRIVTFEAYTYRSNHVLQSW